MANKDLFKQAIADAKSIREAAIANAKLALEESITPELQELLALKLQEMEEEDEKEDVEEAVEEAVEETVEETVEEEVSEEVEEVVAEADEDEEADDESEESDEEAEDEAEGEEPAGDEEVADSDLTFDDLKDMIRDILSQEMGAEEAPAEDMADDMEDMEADGVEAEEDVDDEEISINELLAELSEMTEEVEEEVSEETVSEEEVVAEEETMEEGAMFGPDTIQAAMDVVNSLPGVELGADGVLNLLKGLAIGVPALAIGAGGVAASRADKRDAEKAANEAELAEALTEIETLKASLNETNLLNAKLLYVNKVFKANTLSESQKANVIAAFDKAETVKEVKLVFETISENVATKKEVVKENKGFASAAAGVAPSKPEVISEANDVVRRMQKLAGIIK